MHLKNYLIKIFIVVVFLFAGTKVYASTLPYYYELLRNEGIQADIPSSNSFTNPYFLVLSSQNPIQFIKTYNLYEKPIIVICDNKFLYESVSCNDREVTSVSSSNLVYLGNKAVIFYNKGNLTFILVPKDYFQDSIYKARFIGFLKSLSGSLNIESSVRIKEKPSLTLNKNLVVLGVCFLVYILCVYLYELIKSFYPHVIKILGKSRFLFLKIVTIVSSLTIFFVASDKIFSLFRRGFSLLNIEIGSVVSHTKSLLIFSLFIQFVVLGFCLIIWKLGKKISTLKYRFNISISWYIALFFVQSYVVYKSAGIFRTLFIESIISLIFIYLKSKEVINFSKVKYIDILIMFGVTVCFFFLMNVKKEVVYEELFNHKITILPKIINSDKDGVLFSKFITDYKGRIYANKFLIYDYNYSVIHNVSGKNFKAEGNYVFTATNENDYIDTVLRNDVLYNYLEDRSGRRFLYIPVGEPGYISLNFTFFIDCSEDIHYGEVTASVYRTGFEVQRKVRLFEFVGCKENEKVVAVKSIIYINTYPGKATVIDFRDTERFNINKITIEKVSGNRKAVFLKDLPSNNILMTNTKDKNSDEITSYFMGEGKEFDIEYKNNEKDIAASVNKLINLGNLNKSFKIWSDQRFAVIGNEFLSK